MRHLKIRHVGPIDSVDIELNRFNVFIGAQSSGKSTIAKVLSTCMWLEKEISTLRKANVIASGKEFLEMIVQYHKMDSYFQKDSFVEFRSESVWVKYENGKLIAKLLPGYNYDRQKICYVPSERNMVTLPELQGFEFGATNLRSFLFDWFKARENYDSNNKKEVLNLGIRYFYDKEQRVNKDRIEHENGKTYEIPLSNASSGLQSVVPLMVMLNYYTGKYFDEYTKTLSFDQENRMREIRNRLSDELVIRPLLGTYSNTNRTQFISDFNDRLHSGQLSAKEQELFNIFAKTHSRLLTPSSTSFVVEEPEQNLFPQTQVDMLYYMLSLCMGERPHQCSITTHSPYVLYALNNAMLAWYALQNNVDQTMLETMDYKGVAVNPKEVSVWSIRDGKLDGVAERNWTIQDERGLIRDNYFDRIMGNVMSDFHNLLSLI